MEIAVRDLLDSVMRSDGTDVTARLEPEDQVLLATWMSKCVYAYSADLTPQNRPWSESEYFDLRSSQKPSPRAVIWAGKNVGLTADIVLSVTPLWVMSLRIARRGPRRAPSSGVRMAIGQHRRLLRSVVATGAGCNSRTGASGSRGRRFDAADLAAV